VVIKLYHKMFKESAVFKKDYLQICSEASRRSTFSDLRTISYGSDLSWWRIATDLKRYPRWDEEAGMNGAIFGEVVRKLKHAYD
jgi:hypothetical protein